jgi:hypothetical protein
VKIETVASAFANYRQHVIPRDAPPIQIEECRRAFYAGSYALLLNLAYNIGDESTDEEDGLRHLDALKAECEAYAASVQMPLPEPVEQSTYNVRSTEVESALRELATDLHARVPQGFGFTLLLFSYEPTGLPNEGPAGSLFYISTARREDMVRTMKEFIARQVQ